MREKMKKGKRNNILQEIGVHRVLQGDYEKNARKINLNIIGKSGNGR